MTYALDTRDPVLVIERATRDVEHWTWVAPEDRARVTADWITRSLGDAGLLVDCATVWSGGAGLVCGDGVHACVGYVGHSGRHTCQFYGCRSWTSS